MPRDAPCLMLLLGGWLLMQPPTPDATVPVRRWAQLEVFDTAVECEDHRGGAVARLAVLRADLRADLRAAGARSPQPPPPLRPREDSAAVRTLRAELAEVERQRPATEAARCIPADHVYPPAYRYPFGE